MADINLEKQAAEVLRIAQEHGVEQNFLFLTTFQRYQVQLTILTNLQEKIEQDGALVTKEYVRGRGCVMIEFLLLLFFVAIVGIVAMVVCWVVTLVMKLWRRYRDGKR